MDSNNFGQSDESVPHLRQLNEGAAPNGGYSTGNCQYRQEAPQPRKSGFLRAILWAFTIVSIIVLFFAGIFAVGIIGIGAVVSSVEALEQESKIGVKETIRIDGDSDNRVAVIDVKGIIARSKMSGVACSEKIVELIEHVAKNESDFCALIIDMDTPGGEVIAADEIHSAIRKLKKCAPEIQVVTCMHSMGASGGYYVAAATDYIIANRMTFTGSIGVIMSSYNISELIGKVGISEQVFRSGDMKDMMSPTRKMTEKERAYMQKMIDSTYNEFAKIVSDGREAYKTAEDVKSSSFGDGRVLSGAEAFELKLVDKLGGFTDAVNYIMTTQELDERPSIVQLSNRSSFFDSLMELSERMPLQTRLLPCNAFAMKAGYLYFLLPATVL